MSGQGGRRREKEVFALSFSVVRASGQFDGMCATIDASGGYVYRHAYRVCAYDVAYRACGVNHVACCVKPLLVESSKAFRQVGFHCGLRL